MSGVTPGPWSYFSSSDDETPASAQATPVAAVPAQSVGAPSSGGAAPAPWENGWEETPAFTPTPGPLPASGVATAEAQEGYSPAFNNPVSTAMVGAGDAALRGLSNFVRPLAGGMGYLAGLGAGALSGEGATATAEAYKNAMESATNYHLRTTRGNQDSALPSKIITSVVQQLLNPQHAPIAVHWLSEHFGKEFTHEVVDTYKKYGPMGLSMVPGVDQGELSEGLRGIGQLAEKTYGADQQEANRLADEGHPLAATALGAGPQMALRAAEYLPATGLLGSAAEDAGTALVDQGASWKANQAADEMLARRAAQVGEAPPPVDPSVVEAKPGSWWENDGTPAPEDAEGPPLPERAVAAQEAEAAPGVPAPPPEAAAEAAPADGATAPEPPVTPAEALVRDLDAQTHEDPSAPGARRVNANTSMQVYRNPYLPDSVHVEWIKADEPGTGAGSAAMHHLTTLADKHGVRLSLDPIPFGTAAEKMPQEKLEQFYKTFGFEPTDFNQDENENLMGGMVRRPMGPQVNAAALLGMPALVEMNGKPVMFGPNPMARTAAYNYTKHAGIPYDPPRTYEPITPSRGALIANAYAQMAHNPEDPETKAAYDALIKETKAQWKSIKRTGLKVQFHKEGMPDPYAGNPRLALKDIENRNHLWVHPTSEGYGNPLLNIGLKVGQTGSITPEEATTAIERLGPKIVHAEVHGSQTEPTLVASLNRALSPDEADLLARQLHQEAIVQYAGGKGTLHGPNAAGWGEFNPEYFLTHGGKYMSEVPQHPMLADSGEVLDGKHLTNNDLFRIVHDYYGHAKEGNGFRADGEFNAYRIHKSMYSPLAQKALATETLGQNAWVNHGPFGDWNRAAKQGETVYADQKAGLLPPAVLQAADVPAAEWADQVHGPERTPPKVRSRFALPSEEGAVTDAVSPAQQALNKALIKQTLPELSEVHRAALTRNYADAGQFYQHTRLRDPRGDRARGVLDAGQNAMRAAVGEMAPHVDASAAGTEARGRVVQAAIDHAYNTLAGLDDKYYGEGDARAAGKAANIGPLYQFLTDNKALFYKTPEGKQLFDGLQMRMHDLGLLGNTDAFNPPDAIQIEDLRKYLTGPAPHTLEHLIGGTKDAIDRSMSASAGPAAYTRAHANRALRGKLFERNAALKPFLPPYDGVEANRKVQAAHVMSRLFSKSTSPAEFGAVLDNLHMVRQYLQHYEPDLAPEMDGKLRDAYQALKEENVARLLAKGQKVERGWDQKSFAGELQAQEPKMARIWKDSAMQRWQDINNTGNLLRMDRSYPGAHAQAVNTGGIRHIVGSALEGGISGAIATGAGAINPLLVGPAAGLYDIAAGDKMRSLLRGDPMKKALKEFEQKHIVNLNDPNDTPPIKGAQEAGRGGTIPIPGAGGKVEGFEHVRQPTLGDRLGGGKMRGGPKAARGPSVLDYLTPEERADLKREATVKQLIKAFHDLPPTHEFAAAALAGEGKRHFYRDAGTAVASIFGPDAPRFMALMAALSPQTSVQVNFHNALRTFVNWDKAGRPTSAHAIHRIMDRSLLRRPDAPPGGSPVLPAWFPNSVRALRSKEPENLQLSGPKVDSFMKNLQGNVNEVTNDTHMANFARVHPDTLGALDRKNTVDDLSKTIGYKSPGYLAMSAKAREAAKMLTHLTGDTWTPREVQETDWAFSKTAFEHADQYGPLATIPELVKNGEINDKLIASTPGFHDLFHAPQHREFLRASRYGENVERLARPPGKAPLSASASKAREAAVQALRPHLLSAAERLEKVRQEGGEKTVTNRARLVGSLNKHGMRGKLPDQASE